MEKDISIRPGDKIYLYTVEELLKHGTIIVRDTTFKILVDDTPFRVGDETYTEGFLSNPFELHKVTSVISGYPCAKLPKTGEHFVPWVFVREIVRQ